MSMYVFKTDFNHPSVKRKMEEAKSCEKVNEFSTKEQVATFIANAGIKELRRQLGLSEL